MTIRRTGGQGQALLEIAIALPALLLLLAGAYACCRAAVIASSASSAAQAESIRSGRRLPGLEKNLAGSVLPGGEGVSLNVRSGKKGRLLPSPFPSLAGRTIGVAKVEKKWDETGGIGAVPPLRLERQSEMSVDCWDKGSSSGRKIRRVVRARVALGIIR